AVASTGGQILPPVMGAGAFIMANFLQIPYRDVVLAAIVPALLYFASLLFVVHYRARLDGIRTLETDQISDWRAALKARWHLLIPLVWLAVVIVSGLAVADAAVQASVLTIVLGTLRRSTRCGPLQVVQALVRTSERALSVALPCAVASIIVAVIAFTGLGTKFTALVVHLSAGSLALALVFAAIGSLVLGAGMPTTSAYVMAAVLVAPALVKLGVDPLVAHLFVFYISIMSMVTPPVALAAYAASTISGSRPGATGWWAFYLALPALVIPFAFVLHPALVIWTSVPALAWALVQVIAACWAFAVLVPGWLGRPLGMVERVLFAVGGIACFLTSPALSAAGFALLAILAAFAYRGRSREVAGPDGLAGRKTAGPERR
ncbi:MAG TPA: TRAP transporter fused permease subunit, partial [Gammaproteobacteria bacterium]|nr:TRAP transporter fused permease subunit [Gammaproteobacteria bacterium]